MLVIVVGSVLLTRWGVVLIRCRVRCRLTVCRLVLLILVRVVVSRDSVLCRICRGRLINRLRLR